MRNNKKGFTLVELLAVIVILALIMSIAIISMSGVMQSARESTFKESAASIIEGVKTQLTVNMELVKHGNDYFADGVEYYFTNKILDKMVDAPLGGKYRTIVGTETGYEVIGSNTEASVYVKGTKENPDAVGSCTWASNSHVTVKYDKTANDFVYTICLTSTNGADGHGGAGEDDPKYPFINNKEYKDVLNGTASIDIPE